MIRVLKPGMQTTIQDLGRYGYAHLGVSAGGAADSYSFRLANLLVGNPENASALEMTLLGPTLEFHQAATVAITGSAASTGLPLREAFTVKSGERLDFGSLVSGARAYLAVRGGFKVPPVMNSASTFLPASFGGVQGRALRSGDELAIAALAHHAVRRLRKSFSDPAATERPLRATLGPQVRWFDEKTVEAFFVSEFRVSEQSNRSGLRLSGDAVLASRRSELLTEGVSLGAVQVPPDGQPIILFVDQQTTGGYPKIANVISADLPRLGQLRPRDVIKFQLVVHSEAVGYLRQQERLLLEAFE
jgi:antagonist of KipI